MSEHPAKAKRGIPSKQDFNEWYTFIVEAAELVDKRYPIKGMDVWRPYGWKTMRLIDSLTHAEMERTGHGECNFPLLIPEDLLEKENRLVSLLQRAREQNVHPDELREEKEEAGFKNEVYWVRHAGENELDLPMFLRPTSETAMYTMFPLWIRSHADLPLKIYQIVNTFRYETKQTRSFIRVREIHFFEAHTAHVDEEDATRQIDEDLEMVKHLMQQFALPAIIAKRPLWDTFPGAWYTIGIDVLMPNGKTLQVASIHHYRDQWAKAFDIRYENQDGIQTHVHQTTYGMSERLLGAIIGMHGDDSGLVLPPTISPFQVVIVPILSKDSAEEVTAACHDLRARLLSAGIRTHLDDRDIRPGQKYYDWEIKGVPLRLEFGARDLAQNSVMCASRTGGKSPISLGEVEREVESRLAEVQAGLQSDVIKRMAEVVRPLPSLYRAKNGSWELTEALEEDKVYWMAFNGSDADAEVIEKLTGLSFLGDSLEGLSEEELCCMSGRMTRRMSYLARTY